MGKRLFVGSLPYDTTESQLKELFAACGTVRSVRVIMDRATGQSKGFAFVEMDSDADAGTAIARLNNTAVGARRIVVNEARPMEKRPAGGSAPAPAPRSGGSAAPGGEGGPGGGFDAGRGGPPRGRGGRGRGREEYEERRGGREDKGTKGRQKQRDFGGWDDDDE